MENVTVRRSQRTRDRIELNVVINRPVEEVYAYMSNPENNSQWQSHCRGSVITSEGPLSVGTTFTDVIKFLGRRIESIWEITEYDPNRKVSFKSTSSPIPAKGGYTYGSVEGGTKVTVVGEVEPGGLLKLAKPIIVREGKSEWETSLANLKHLLEAQA